MVTPSLLCDDASCFSANSSPLVAAGTQHEEQRTCSGEKQRRVEGEDEGPYVPDSSQNILEHDTSARSAQNAAIAEHSQRPNRVCDKDTAFSNHLVESRDSSVQQSTSEQPLMAQDHQMGSSTPSSSEADPRASGTSDVCCISAASSLPAHTVAALVNDFNEKSMQCRRVKCYEADQESGQWEERGVGYVYLAPNADSGNVTDVRIRVTASADPNDASGESLLDTSILSNTNYCLQNKCLVTWLHAPQLRCLSFVKQTACSDFWSLLQIAAPDRIGSEDDDDEDDAEEDDEAQGGSNAYGAKEDHSSSPNVSAHEATDVSLTIDSHNDVGEEPNSYSTRLGPLSSRIPLVSRRATVSEEEEEEEEDEEDAMENQMKFRRTVIGTMPGGLSSLLEDYEDSVVLQTSLDPTERLNQQTSAANRSTNNRSSFLLPYPHTAEALAECLAHIHCLERQAATFPDQVAETLSYITEQPWLSSLWGLLHRAIAASDEAVCNSIADFLCRIVTLYALRSNPFTSLAVSPESERCLTPRDPLVRLLSDTHYLNFFRAMEYELELRKHHLKLNHVDFLQHTSRFKEVICRNDEAFRITCHFIYRVSYLRDVCLPRHLDESTLQRLTGIVRAGYLYLCRMIQLTPNCIAELRYLITEDVVAARFLHQLLTVLRSNTDESLCFEKFRILSAMRTEGVLEALEGYLTGNCPAVYAWRKEVRERRHEQELAQQRITAVIAEDVERRHRPSLLSHERLTLLTPVELAVEILYLTVEFRVVFLRSAILRQAAENVNERPTFWYALCDTFQATDNEGVHIQLAEMFKNMLDPESVDSPERDDFFSIFYDKGVLDRLINILFLPVPMTYHDLIATSVTDTAYSEDAHRAGGSGAPSQESDHKGHRLCYFIPNFSVDDDACVYDVTAESFSRRQEVSPSDAFQALPLPNPWTSDPSADADHRDSATLSTTPTFTHQQTPYKKYDTSFAPEDTLEDKPSSCSGNSYATYRHTMNSDLLHPKRRAVSVLPSHKEPVPEDYSSAWDPETTDSKTAFLPEPTSCVNESVSQTESGTTLTLQSSAGENDQRTSLMNSTNDIHPASDVAVPSQEPRVYCDEHQPHQLSVTERLRGYLESLSEEEREEVLLASRAQLSYVKCRITEILAFCVLKHNSRIKYRNFQQNLHLRVLQMSYEPIFNQSLAIYGVKFLRACLMAEPDHYARIFIRHNIFRLLLHLLKTTLSHVVPRSRSEGSLLESVILEFFNFISISIETSPAIASLVKALFDRHLQACEALARFYRDVCQYELFSVLRAQYDEILLSEKRGAMIGRHDALSDAEHSCWSATDFGGKLGAGHRLSRSLSRGGPPRAISADEAERELEESYFALDDDGDNDYPAHQASNGGRAFNSPIRFGNTALDTNDDHPSTSFSSFLLSTGITSGNPTESALPRFSFAGDEDDDDSEVPAFLKSSGCNNSSSNSTTNTNTSFGPPVLAASPPPRAKPSPSLSLKLCLQPPAPTRSDHPT